MTISVGKNVARILDREFPIDTDLTLNKVRSTREVCFWSTESSREDIQFTPIKEGEVTSEAYRTYNQALRKSIAFNQRGKMRKLFDRKEEGVKIIPGHGVFILPSKMQVVMKGPREVQIRVFGGTEFAKNFHYSNYDTMVKAAAEHYFENIRTVTESINESLWFPVKYGEREEVRTFEGIAIPSGVIVRRKESKIVVEYYSSKHERTHHFGYVNSAKDLPTMLIEAEDQRHKEQLVTAMYRFVRPSYVPLSQYMKTV